MVHENENLELKERFTQNVRRIHELKKDVCHLEQGGDTVVTYYTKLKALWDELDEYVDVYERTCPAAARQVRDKEIMKLHQFLVRLDTRVYRLVCSQILNTDPLPSISTAISIVNQEEKRRRTSKREGRIDGRGILSRGQQKAVCHHLGRPQRGSRSAWPSRIWTGQWQGDRPIRSSSMQSCWEAHTWLSQLIGPWGGAQKQKSRGRGAWSTSGPRRGLVQPVNFPSTGAQLAGSSRPRTSFTGGVVETPTWVRCTQLWQPRQSQWLLDSQVNNIRNCCNLLPY